jgi:hypothetical protein
MTSCFHCRVVRVCPDPLQDEGTPGVIVCRVFNEASFSYSLRVNPLWEELLGRTPPSVQQYLITLLEDWQLSLSASPEAADLSFASLEDVSVGYLRVEDYYLPDGRSLENRIATFFENRRT